MLGLHWPELLIIVSLGVLLFGSKKLPELSRSIGKGIVEFKKSVSGGASSDEKLPPPKE
jgi:TatA/E family protein of Tat protein translocase